MSSLEQHHSVLLQKCLADEFIPYLPPLLDKTKPEEEQNRKNLSRAFSAFAIHRICGVPKLDAAASVIDDFDDYGIDAIYYHALTETLYLVQSKLKATEEFKQDEALAFCQGIKKLIKQDFNGFNPNVQNRKAEIEDALDNCSQIQLVVAHTGTGITKHAKGAIDELLADNHHGEERLQKQVINYDAHRVLQDLRDSKAYERVDVDLWVQKCSSVAEPRVTYFGLIPLEDLVCLHNSQGKALYERNIRTFLGHQTEVNASIQRTLASMPQDFLYLNNGITALCQEINPKSDKGGKKRLKIRGFTVINGAQTIASSAQFLDENKAADISKARVFLTLIKADADGSFGKSVTRARNHQNPVLLSNFAALDDEQERLRREIAHLKIRYAYKAEGPDTANKTNRIRIDEAAQALSMLQQDPRYVVWLKKEPARLLDTSSEQYKALFSKAVTAFQLINAVRVNRFIQQRMEIESLETSGQERLVYKHGSYAMAWVLAKRLRSAISSPALIDEGKLAIALSVPFDELRQMLWEKTNAATLVTEGPPPEYFRGPLALFRNQTDVVPLLQEVAIASFGLTQDPVVEHKRQQQAPGQPYPEGLFAYLISKAPQIGNLS